MHKDAVIDPTAFIPPTAIVWGMSYGKRATVGEGATVNIRAAVSDKSIWLKSPLFVMGTKHAVFQPKPGFIQIGCRAEKLSWWKTSEAELFAKKNGYDASEIKEYSAIIDFIIMAGVK